MADSFPCLHCGGTVLARTELDLIRLGIDALVATRRSDKGLMKQCQDLADKLGVGVQSIQENDTLSVREQLKEQRALPHPATWSRTNERAASEIGGLVTTPDDNTESPDFATARSSGDEAMSGLATVQVGVSEASESVAFGHEDSVALDARVEHLKKNGGADGSGNSQDDSVGVEPNPPLPAAGEETEWRNVRDVDRDTPVAPDPASQPQTPDPAQVAGPRLVVNDPAKSSGPQSIQEPRES